MIRTFRSKALAHLWTRGTSSKIDGRLYSRILRRLEALDAAATPEDMNFPGYDFHALHGDRPIRYTVHVNGPWCITFEFSDSDALRIGFEQYH